MRTNQFYLLIFCIFIASINCLAQISNEQHIELPSKNYKIHILNDNNIVLSEIEGKKGSKKVLLKFYNSALSLIKNKTLQFDKLAKKDSKILHFEDENQISFIYYDYKFREPLIIRKNEKRKENIIQIKEYNKVTNEVKTYTNKINAIGNVEFFVGNQDYFLIVFVNSIFKLNKKSNELSEIKFDESFESYSTLEILNVAFQNDVLAFVSKRAMYDTKEKVSLNPYTHFHKFDFSNSLNDVNFEICNGIHSNLWKTKDLIHLSDDYYLFMLGNLSETNNGNDLVLFFIIDIDKSKAIDFYIKPDFKKQVQNGSTNVTTKQLRNHDFVYIFDVMKKSPEEISFFINQIYVNPAGGGVLSSNQNSTGGYQMVNDPYTLHEEHSNYWYNYLNSAIITISKEEEITIDWINPLQNKDWKQNIIEVKNLNNIGFIDALKNKAIGISFFNNDLVKFTINDDNSINNLHKYNFAQKVLDGKVEGIKNVQIKKWYANYYLAYGDVKISLDKKEKGKSKKTAFYLSKMKID